MLVSITSLSLTLWKGGTKVAELSYSGLDELMLSMQEVAEIPDDIQDEMLNAGADVVVQAQRKSARDMGVKRTELTINSIKKTKVKVKNGKRVIYIYPQGTRIRGDGKDGKPVRVRNAEIAFINEYGTRRRQPARPFVLTGNETSAEATTQAQAAVYNRWLESKGL